MLTRRSEIVPGSSQKMLEKSRRLNVDCVVRPMVLVFAMLYIFSWSFSHFTSFPASEA